MKIIKRSGEEKNLDMNKIYKRIKSTAKGLKVISEHIASQVVGSLPTGDENAKINTRQIDDIVAQIASAYTSTHHDYSKLAGRVAISSLYKHTHDNLKDLYEYLLPLGIINERLLDKLNEYGADKVMDLINEKRDDLFDYFAWMALANIYLLKNPKGEIVERPQFMYMRMALWLSDTFEECREIYDYVSKHLISFATPIMINSGTKNPQLSSCVLINLYDDSRNGMLDALVDACNYSSDAAGIGFNVTPLRSKKSKITTSGGNASGVLKYAKMLNEGMRTFNQQGRRPGSCAIYIETWHKDIFDVLELRNELASDDTTARDLFMGLWVSDNFMKAVVNDDDWYLFCPHEIKQAGLKHLYDIYGEEFEAEYQKAIDLGLGEKIKAKELWQHIIKAQIETGLPYMLYKDNVNNKSNHQMYGTVKSSNLCSEIIQYTDSKTIATCTLASQVVKNYIERGKFNFELLRKTTNVLTRCLNKVIDINHYSAKKGEKGAMEQRAIGIGIQGLANLYFELDYVFTSPEAKQLNKDIYETIYFGALQESNRLVKEQKYPLYHKFDKSPMGKGILQFDMWGLSENDLSGKWDWKSLRESIKKDGLTNSLCVTQMPTASSSRATNSYESFEPIGSNIFKRTVNGGSFTITNNYLIEDLEELGIWNLFQIMVLFKISDLKIT
jgi:ribonucleoside-diphosphate reductase alpha chain